MIKQLQNKIDNPSDINEHLVTLSELSTECSHITEMGVRGIVSTWAFVDGLKSGTLISIDIADPAQFGGKIEDVMKVCKDKGLEFKFILGDTRTIDIEPTDLLFIDTNHTGIQLRIELTRHADKAKKYIVLHDTESCAPELWPVILEFIGKEWGIKKVYQNNNGLVVLARLK